MDDQIETIRSMIKPDKLARVGPVTDARPVLGEAARPAGPATDKAPTAIRHRGGSRARRQHIEPLETVVCARARKRWRARDGTRPLPRSPEPPSTRRTTAGRWWSLAAQAQAANRLDERVGTSSTAPCSPTLPTLGAHGHELNVVCPNTSTHFGLLQRRYGAGELGDDGPFELRLVGLPAGSRQCAHTSPATASNT